MRSKITALIEDRRGATAIEYALIAALISIFVVGALMLFQGEMNDMYQYISSHLTPVFEDD